jgi:uncharacterized protein YecE (DUF72 family)
MVKHQLQFYASQFSTTELNGVFYRTPSLETVRAWRDSTGRDFLFAWKASQFITHWKRLSSDCANSLQLIEERLEILGPKAGPVLFQLPPNFSADLDRLRAFIRLLNRRRRYAFEFRHPSWYNDNVYETLSRRNISLCISDHHHAPAPWHITADFVYIRGHGPTGRYEDHYSKKTIFSWARKARDLRKKGYEVFFYFDNDQKAAAPVDAARLRELTSDMP